MRPAFAPVLLCLALGLAPAGAANAAQLRQIQLLETGSGTRVSLDVSELGGYKSFSLQGPDRLVVDLKGAQLAPGFRLPAANGAVTEVRTGRPVADTLRIVLDLGTPVAASALRAEQHGDRTQLVLDLASPVAQAAAATPPPSLNPTAPEAMAPAPVAATPAIAPADVPPADRATVPAKTPAKTIEDVIGATPRKLVVAIDAGHGGKDPGAHGPNGVREKQVTLAIARDLAQRVDADPGMRAVLIRDDDTFVPLQERYMRARAAQADLFISIHADASPNRTATGASVYVLSTRGASSQAARWLADQENTADLVGGVSLDEKDPSLAAVLLDLSQSATMRASDDVAGQVLASLKQVGKAHKPGVERANFVVLRSPDVPSMLVETGFITNPGEEKHLADPDYRGRLADAIAAGVRRYFSDQPPPGSWYAMQNAAGGRNNGARDREVMMVPVVAGTPE
jgi:N-acetylmuramoyl-L-alanine amidase